MKFKLSPEALREVRRAIYSARLALHLANFWCERGDMYSARRYRFEARDYMYEARRAVDRDEFAQVKQKTAETLRLLSELFPEVVQYEPASEQVSTLAAPGQLRVRGVLVRPGASQKIGKPERVHIQLVNFDGISPRRDVFPRLGKHWAPASQLVGYQERKGHSLCRV